MNTYVILDGKTIPASKGLVSLNNRSFRYGDGCFETIKVIKGKINLLGFHIDRLFAAIDLLGFEKPASFTPELVAKSIVSLVVKNGHQSLARVRLALFAGEGGLYDGERRNLHYSIQSWPLDSIANNPNENGLVIGLYDKGFKAADGFSQLKSNNFLLYSMAALHAKKERWNDSVLLNHRGDICDATIANIFIINGKDIITPALQDGPVDGTMRRYLLQQLPKLGFHVSEKTLTIGDIEAAEECFISNAIHGIKWVQQFGEHTYRHKQSSVIYNEIIRPLWKD